MFPKASCAVTVKEKPEPAVGVAVAALSASLPAGAALTVWFALAERRLAASEAVSVSGPALASVTEKVPWPLVSVESGGSTTPAVVSVLLKWTVPLYELTGLPGPSSAVTVTVNAWPAVALAGAVSLRSWRTPGAPNRKPFRRLVVVCWIRASVGMLVRVPALLKLSSPQLQAMVPVAKTQAPLGAW